MQATDDSLAHRIATVLSRGGRFVLLTGDPSANSQILFKALRKVVGPLYVVIQIPSGLELEGEDFARAVSLRSWPTASGGAAVKPKCSVSASPLFVFADLDQLSDR